MSGVADSGPGADGLYVPLAEGDLRLVPLVAGHREGLRAACAQDSAIWAIYPFNYAGADFDPQFERMLAGPPARRCYAVLLGGAVVGMTAWIEHGAPGWSVEIGNSFVVPALRGSGLNTRMKRLMLDHAFACGLERVAFKVDAINLRSRAAVLKLGCREEGVMRHERRTWTGRLRDTVLYSVLRGEWSGRA
jgi:RimJ/RimL family protein N-acetyltransferase